MRSQQDGYKDQIEVLSFSWGVTQTGGYSYGTGGSAARSNLQDLSLSIRYGPASPKLFQYCASGKHLDSAVITCLQAGGDKPQKYLEIKLTDVIISSYQTGGSGDDKPIDSLSLNFAKVEYEAFSQDDKGITKSSGKGSWDQQKVKSEK